MISSRAPSGEAAAASPRSDLAAALEALRGNGLVAFPTETVWGLAACARSPAALSALAAWKGRGERQPISILVSGPGILPDCGFDPDRRALGLMERFWPGPLTLILPCEPLYAPGIARVDGAVGVRCSSHPRTAELVLAAEGSGLGPITATSCNRSGEPPARSEAEAVALCSGGAGSPRVLAEGAGDAPIGEPSTVLDLVAEPPQILRQGGLDAEVLAPYLDMRDSSSVAAKSGGPEGQGGERSG